MMTWPSLSLERLAARSVKGSIRRRSGFTLVEVIVALLVFVIGAVAIIRIFPPALGVIQNSGDRAAASRLNRTTLARFESNPGLVPDAIYDANGTAWQDFPAALVGTRNYNKTLPEDLTANAYNDSALGRFKRVSGEKHTVLTNLAGNAPPGQPFVLTRHPFDGNVRVYQEDRVEDVRIRRDGSLDFSEAKLASDGSDFHNPSGALQDRPYLDPASVPDPLKSYRRASTPDTPGDTIFYVSYRFRKFDGAGNRHLNGVVDEPKGYPLADTRPDATPVPPEDYVMQGNDRLPSTNTSTPGPDVNSVVEGEVGVRFRRLLGSVAATDDQRNRGLLILPAGLNVGDTISLDYTVRGWDYLVDDSLPSQAPSPAVTPVPPVSPLLQYEVKLPVRNLSDAGDARQILIWSLLMHKPLNDKTTTNNYPDAEPNNPNQFYFAGDDVTTPADAGTNADSGNYWNETNNGTPEQNRGRVLTADLKNGSVVYNVAGLNAPRARTVYRTLDRWTHQVAVAARSYYPFIAPDPSIPVDPHTPPENWRQYVWTPGSEGGRLYFHPSEAGKTVLVTYEFQVSGTIFREARDVVVNIADEILDSKPSSVPASFLRSYQTTTGLQTNTAVAQAVLTDNRGNQLGSATAILAVRGIGVQSRTAWLDGNRYSQTTSSAYRSAGSF